MGGTSLEASESVYIVKSGDSLWKISAQQGISIKEIKEINHLSSDSLKIGQKLLLGGNREAEAGKDITAVGQESYTVQAGDNLGLIAQKFGMTVARLKELNNLNSDILNEGHQLRVENRNLANPSRSGVPLDGRFIIEKAAQYLGTAYRYGGEGPAGFDCSGFVRYIFSNFGYDLPHNAAAQFKTGAELDGSEMKIGDLVFFACGGRGIDHVGIYSGDMKFIHSSSPRSGGVIYSSLSEGYYAGKYVGARRIFH
ncbi:MAG: NlpC/P60 family protein [Syntrophomonas sp.]|uniref:C40 family peptidase n=1 Tax=Syntrophomonas sp. TaxID=2053627 RepID=UPI0026118CFE|nr:C40 family peptidase [Syntrophomonas sp.]MDD3879404.1 NlpC/P60 family protein [Syntrophomonas sp.]MDD4625843.1 NlpC/P60 family protein [Syntrophomonas sp.]